MPRPRKQTSALFAVSPWQSRADKSEDAVAAEDHDASIWANPTTQAAGYSVLELPLVLPGGSGAASLPPAAAGGSSPGAEGDTMCVDPPLQQHASGNQQESLQQKQPHATNMAEAPPSPPLPAPTPALEGGGGWVAKKRKPAEEEADNLHGSSSPLAADDEELDGPEGATAGAECEGGAGSAPAEGAAGRWLELEGTAYLALLPNSSITGHLVCPAGVAAPHRSFGVMGEVMLAGRECTRDADWGVLRMTLLSFASSASASSTSGGCQLSFLAERTEGDAMRLRAPVPWQGIELEELPELEAACGSSGYSSSSGLQLEFNCQQLLSGSAGDAVLRRLQPSLAGKGALLNVGQMRVVLPPEAADVLLGRGQALAGAQQRQQGQQQGQQQRLLCSGGGSGGRVVTDSGDDW